ncbi:MAG: ANTAR domain-containing protein [Peptostreptococcaceae bacterium]|nr:ANTAR domain-containing protein [Peptostreptococcaceae bacterium]
MICASKLSDMSVFDSTQSLNGSAMLLVIAASSQLTIGNSDDIFKLPTPVSRTDLIASVRMLVQMEQKYLRLTLPRRSSEDAKLIEMAKELLMNKHHISEEQAHSFIQKKVWKTDLRCLKQHSLF